MANNFLKYNLVVRYSSFLFCLLFIRYVTISPGYLTLATACHELYTNKLFADLQIVIRERNEESKEHVILAHRFILDAFAPTFLQLLLTSRLAIEGTQDNNTNNNDNNNNINNNNIQKVYCNQFRPKIVDLFLVSSVL